MKADCPAGLPKLAFLERYEERRTDAPEAIRSLLARFSAGQARLSPGVFAPSA